MNAKSAMVLPLLVSIIVVSVAIAGCSSQAPAANPVTQSPAPLPPGMTVTTPAGTNAPSVSATVTSIPVALTGNPDAAFIEASEKCFNETPVIGNRTTEIAFIACFQKSPKPVSQCAGAYRQNILRYTNDDTTTAGFNRMNYNIQQLRTMYFDGVWWDVLRYGWFPCEGREGEFKPVTYHQDD